MCLPPTANPTSSYCSIANKVHENINVCTRLDERGQSKNDNHDDTDNDNDDDDDDDHDDHDDGNNDDHDHAHAHDDQVRSVGAPLQQQPSESPT